MKVREKLRIGIVLQGSAAWVGGVEYSRNLIKALLRMPEDQIDACVLSAGPIDRRLYADMPACFWEALHENLDEMPAPFWIRVGHRLAPRRIPGGSRLVRHAWRLGVHFLYPWNRPAWDHDIAGAAWIPDFQHRALPHLFSTQESGERDHAYAEFVQAAPAVVLSSEHTAHELRQFQPDAADKAHVLRFCTVAEDAWFEQDAAMVARQYGLGERFFIVCNQFWKHKNHAVIFDALALLKQRGIEPTVVCTGHIDDYRHREFAAQMRRQIEESGASAQVRLLGLLPRQEQIQLMRRALAVIQPSLCEGWSTVVEDCRALGKRVALSDIPVHREQNPPGAVFLAPHDAEGMAQLLSTWWRDMPTGPNIEIECTARTANEADVFRYGKRFLSIAQSVVAESRALISNPFNLRKASAQ